ncbi:hypothetical protein D6D29_07969 [Aureobasidium pullulans]|nr:hypothetical protein D6D29_07969 [Aureobasidium pullulans]
MEHPITVRPTANNVDVNRNHCRQLVIAETFRDRIHGFFVNDNNNWRCSVSCFPFHNASPVKQSSAAWASQTGVWFS